MKSPLSRRFFVGIFEREEDILGATKAARALGYKITDVYAPYAVHGLEKAMGLQPSKLPWVCFLLGLLGAALKVWFEFWTSAVDWPINVGGKPWNSLPAFVPVTFEVMVLFAGVSTVIAFLFVSRLQPGRKPAFRAAGITDHQFVIVLEETDAAFDIWQVRKLFQQFGAVHMEEQVARGKL